MSISSKIRLLVIVALTTGLAGCVESGCYYIPPDVQESLEKLRTRDPAVQTLRAAVIRSDSATTGRIQITAIITNIGALDYESDAGLQTIVLYEGTTAVAQQDFEDLAVNASVLLTYDRDWDTMATGLPDFRVVIEYDASVATDASDTNDDTNLEDNERTLTATQVNAAFGS
ncbi:MAG: hypothetical protein JXO22_15125 [Phycisphaerae bacterium]|nr:hypothetical protein [Phycisphaerae bacterium]